MRRPAAAAVLSTLVTALVVMGLGAAPQASANQWTPSSYTSRLISLLNQTRAQHGLAALTVASGTTEVASAWTSHMASGGGLAHNPDLQHQLETHGSPDWTTYGENVGDGPSDNPDALFKAYMNSPEHKANILNGGYRFMGVAVVFSGSTAWNTFDFVDTYHTAKTATAPKPKPQPKPTATHVALRAAAPAPTPAATQPAPVTTTSTPATAPVHRHPKPAHHDTTHARPAAVRGQVVARHPIAERPITTGVRPVALSFAAPTPLTVPSEVAISLAAGLIGFLGVRWLQVARTPRYAAALR